VDSKMDILTNWRLSIQSSIELLSTQTRLREVEEMQQKINVEIKSLTQAIKTLKAGLVDIRQESDRNSVQTRLNEHSIVASGLHSLVRGAMLKFHANYNKRHLSNRHALLEDEDPAVIERRRRQEEESDAVSKMASATSALQRIQSNMHSELNRTAAAMTVLESSSKTMRSIGREFDTYHSAMTSGKKALTKIAMRERTDRLLVLLGFAFFLLVVFYILKKRLAPFLPSLPIPSITGMIWSFLSLFGPPSAKVATVTTPATAATTTTLPISMQSPGPSGPCADSSQGGAVCGRLTGASAETGPVPREIPSQGLDRGPPLRQRPDSKHEL